MASHKLPQASIFIVPICLSLVSIAPALTQNNGGERTNIANITDHRTQPCRLTVTAALPQASCRSEQEKLEHKNNDNVFYTRVGKVQKPKSSIDPRSVNPQQNVSCLSRRAILFSSFFDTDVDRHSYPLSRIP